MLSPKIYYIFRTTILCILLITSQPTKPLFTENFDFSAYHYYIITCLTSCCIGAFLCTFIQKYCCNQSTIVPKQNSQKENVKQLFEELHQKIDTTKTEIEKLIQKKEEKTINLLIEHNNNMNQFIDLCHDNIQTRQAKLVTKIKTLRQKEEEFLELSQLLKNNNTNLFIASTLYWFKQCEKKAKECENLKITQLQIDQFAQM